MKKITLLLTCEHAVDTIPDEYQHLIAPFHELLATHRGIDFGALSIAQFMAKTLDCELIQAHVSRLIIDCNRSLRHVQCFSEVTASLSQEEQQECINQYYLPYRQEVMTHIQKQIDYGFRVLHFSIHSFTPILNNTVRNADIGLLYDPRRSQEKLLVKLWQAELKKQAPEYRVRKNYPYTGSSDGLTSALRKQGSEQDYIGIEVESNQALVQDANSLNALGNALAQTLLAVIHQYRSEP